MLVTPNRTDPVFVCHFGAEKPVSGEFRLIEGEEFNRIPVRLPGIVNQQQNHNGIVESHGENEIFCRDRNMINRSLRFSPKGSEMLRRERSCIIGSANYSHDAS